MAFSHRKPLHPPICVVVARAVGRAPVQSAVVLEDEQVARLEWNPHSCSSSSSISTAQYQIELNRTWSGQGQVQGRFQRGGMVRYRAGFNAASRIWCWLTCLLREGKEPIVSIGRCWVRLLANDRPAFLQRHTRFLSAPRDHPWVVRWHPGEVSVGRDCLLVRLLSLPPASGVRAVEETQRVLLQRRRVTLAGI